MKIVQILVNIIQLMKIKVMVKIIHKCE